MRRGRGRCRDLVAPLPAAAARPGRDADDRLHRRPARRCRRPPAPAPGRRWGVRRRGRAHQSHRGPQRRRPGGVRERPRRVPVVRPRACRSRPSRRSSRCRRAPRGADPRRRPAGAWVVVPALGADDRRRVGRLLRRLHRPDERDGRQPRPYETIIFGGGVLVAGIVAAFATRATLRPLHRVSSTARQVAELPPGARGGPARGPRARGRRRPPHRGGAGRRRPQPDARPRRPLARRPAGLRDPGPAVRRRRLATSCGPPSRRSAATPSWRARRTERAARRGLARCSSGSGRRPSA